MILLKYTDVKGDVQITDHKEWIRVGTMQFGVGRGIGTPMGGNDRETSNPSLSEITLTKEMDVASGGLFQMSLNGDAKEVEIHVLQTGGGQNDGKPYLKIKLYNVLISGYSFSTSGSNPSESLSLNFTKIEFKYDKYESGGTLKEGTPVIWDIQANKLT